MRHGWMITAGLALTVLTPGRGQVADSGAPARDTLVLAHEFSGPRTEFVRTTLEAGQVYRVEVTGARSAQIRTLEQGVQQPAFSRAESGVRASGTIVFELRPFATTTYEIRVSGIRDGSAPVKIWWDARASRARQKVQEG